MTEKILTFYLAENLLGINVTLVKEINRNIEYTSIPGSKDYIVGFFNMRGQVVTLFDLAKLLDLNRSSERKNSICIILKKPKDPNQVGFLIDMPGDVIEIDREEYEQPPANIGTVESEFIDSVVKLKEELLILVDPNRIFKDPKDAEL